MLYLYENSGMRIRGPNAKCRLCRNRVYRSDGFHRPTTVNRGAIDFISKVTQSKSSVYEKVCAISLNRVCPCVHKLKIVQHKSNTTLPKDCCRLLLLCPYVCQQSHLIAVSNKSRKWQTINDSGMYAELVLQCPTFPKTFTSVPYGSSGQQNRSKNISVF
jgi:hypothetical protein